MENVILSQIPIDELVSRLKQAVLEELTATNANGREGPTERPVTTEELCNYLRVTEPTISRWKKKGKIPFFTIGTAVRFNLKEVLKSLEK